MQMGLNAVGGVMQRCHVRVMSQYSGCFAEDDEQMNVMQSNGITQPQQSSVEHEQALCDTLPCQIICW